MAIKKILVIEDDRFIGEMYVRSLQREGYTVDWVVDGHDGFVAATNKPYDLILLDIMLPEMRGSEILMQHNVDAYLIKAEITPRRLIEIIKKFDADNLETKQD